MIKARFFRAFILILWAEMAEILINGYLSPNYSIYEMDSPNYGRKGGCFLKFILFFLLFIILLIWVYYKNFKLAF